MSRWSEELKNHEAFTLIEQILPICDALIEKHTENIEIALELQRTKSALIFTNKTFNSYVPELAPIRFIATLKDPLLKIKSYLDSFDKNGNTVLVYNPSNPNDANSVSHNIDLILHGAQMYSNNCINTEGFASLIEEHEQYINTFKENALAYVEIKNKAEASLQDITKKITDINGNFFGIEGDQDSIQKSIQHKINSFLEEATKNNASIQKYYDELLDDGNTNSIKAKIQTFQINAKKDSEELNKLLLNIQKETKELRSFHVDVYGTETDKQGLKKDIDEMLGKLNKYEDTQKTAHAALLENANKLLSLTTTIGLSKAFNNLKQVFMKANYLWNSIFIVSICAMLYLATTIYPTEKSSFGISAIIGQTSQASIAKSEESIWVTILSNFSKELPFYIPLAWLAIYASRRRSENKRLEQEYAHKEAVAITYDSYKNQIDLIGAEHNKEMLLKLLNTAIDAVGYNASETLDNSKHSESTPSHELLQEIFSKVKDFTPEMIKKLSGK